MLSLIRKYANSAPVKAFLAILAFAFVFCFGISDIIRRVIGKDYIVKVGNIKISLPAFNLEKSRKHNLLLERGETTEDDKTETHRILHEIIWESIIDLASKDFGFIVSEETIKRYIAGMSVFRDKDGRFRPEALRAFLYKIKVPEPLFIEFSGKDIKNELIKTPFKYVSVFNELDYYTKSILEKRSLAFIELTPASIHLNLNPSNDALESFYSEHSDLFLLPETRSFKILRLFEKDVESKIVVDDAELREYYETSPEKDDRTFEDMKAEIFDELKQNKLQSELDDRLRQVEDALIGGASVEDIVKQFGLDVVDVRDITAENTSGKVKDVLTLPYKNDILSVAFSTDENAESSFAEAAESDGNRVMWLVHVDSITPKHVAEYESAKDLVRSEYLKDKKHTEALKLAASLSEGKASSFAQTAARCGYSVSVTPAFNRYGKVEEPESKDKKKQKKKNEIEKKHSKIISKLADSAFDMPNEKISYTEIGDNVVVYKLNEVLPPEDIDSQKRTDLHVELVREFTTDMYQQLVTYLSNEKFDVQINYEMLKETTGEGMPIDDIIF